ncbi:MAG: hypothetical protein M3R24_02135 [Chloroflexota bacterium]|nr:hypothetical protein [Chloroflexota bacterium]
MKVFRKRSDIKELDPIVDTILSLVGALAFERGQNHVPLSQLKGIDLGPAADIGFLLVNDDAISFTHEELLYQYTVRHAANLLGSTWDDLVGFVESFKSVEHRGINFGTRREFGSGVLIVLANEDQRDLVHRMAEIAELASTDENGRHAFWALYPPFCKALPEINADPQNVASASKVILQAGTGDLMGGLLYGAIEQYASTSAETADDLYQVFIASPDPISADLAIRALCGLATSDILEAHQRALGLTCSNSPAFRHAGIVTLGRLAYSTPGTEAMLAETVTRLDELRVASATTDAPALAQAYGELLPHEPGAAQALIELAGRSDAEVQHAVAWILSRHADKEQNKEWVIEALLELAEVSSENIGTFRYLDQCASDLISMDLNAVLEFIEALILGRSYGSGTTHTTLPKMLEVTFIELYQNHMDALNNLITCWFASNDRRLHRAARDIIEHPETERPIRFQLSKPVLDSLDEENVAYIVMRVAGYGIFGPQLAALVLSAVQREPCTPDLQAFVTDMLCNYVLYNNPGGAGTYLSERLKAQDATETEITVAQNACERARVVEEARQALPPLKEFQPSSHHVYLVRLAEQKQRARMMEQVEKDSVLLSLVHKAPLKYGRAFFFERDGTFSEPVPLHSFAQSVELPRGELIDPVGQANLRIHWQSVGLVEDQRETPPDDQVSNQDS